MSQKCPAVSVVVPLYNKEAYIRRALTSIMAQTFKDFELIVVDDGSTDNGPAAVAEYGDPRIRLIRQANSGPGAARNRGIEEARSDLVAFLDADDEWMPEFLATHVGALVENPDCDVSVCWYLYDSDRRHFRDVVRTPAQTYGPWRLSPAATDDELRHTLDMFLCGSVCCRRRTVRALGGFYSADRCSFGEDTFLWLALVMNCRVFRIDQALAHYHHECSGLAAGGFVSKPLEPCLTDSHTILDRCPAEYRGLCERWLAQYALGIAHMRVSAGLHDDAVFLIRAFPCMKRWPWEYVKLRLKILFPSLVRPLRVAKAQFHGGAGRSKTNTEALPHA
ncbi:MAG: glycosyltransferase family A protein [Candidatus Sumerlaeota bacterium]|nr:glycosyltransferase family A protein [Candidatus Sumerlaeota bacterium]